LGATGRWQPGGVQVSRSPRDQPDAAAPPDRREPLHRWQNGDLRGCPHGGWLL